MMHDYHDGLPGFSAAQILHDGCSECEYRAAHVSHGIGELDTRNFARAWQRAYEWNHGGLDDVSHAEGPLLNVLWAVQVQLERRGIPVGEVPTGELSYMFGELR